MSNLEEVNLAWTEMKGYITEDLKALTKLKYINLSHNELNSEFPDFEEWKDFVDLEIIEISHNDLFGEIPSNWAYLPSLVYINAANNMFIEDYQPLPLFNSSVRLEGIDLSNNNLKTFPYAYFEPDTFRRLEFVNINGNPQLKMPEVCVRSYFCFK